MPQPEKKLDPGASPAEWFGFQVRQRRKEQGLSARALGRLVQVSDDMVLSIEKGQYPSCRREVAQRLDAVLETGGLFDGAWPMVFGKRDAEKSRPDADKRARRPENGSVRVLTGSILENTNASSPRSGSQDPVDRRNFLVGTAVALAPIDLVQAFAPTALTLPAAIGAAHIDQLRGIATSISGWDNRFGGGGMVHEVAESAMQWAAGLLQAQCPDDLRAELFAAVSRLGLVVGASAFDSCAHAYATRAFRFAADCAEEAGDWHLRAKSFSLLARQSVWVGQPDEGLTYAEKGLVRADRLAATERAMLHTARARAFGKLGRVQECLAAVGQADEEFAQAQPEEVPPWMRYYDAAQHAGDTAHGLFDLVIGAGQSPGRAARRFDAAVQGHADGYARSRALSTTKLASLAMAKGDPRQAAALGNDALDAVGRLTSRRAADDLRQLGALAAPHRRIPEVSALRTRIATTVAAA